MLQGGYKIRDQSAIHFLTFTVVEWIDVFTRQAYRDTLLESLRFCQVEKGLLLHCWCLMSNHLHLIVSAKNANLSDITRDFKKFTSKALIKAISTYPGESRRDWMLKLFSQQGAGNLRNKDYQFWRQDNHPEEIYSPWFLSQKMDYIHDNPVVAGIVDHPWEYLYSSARDYHKERQCGLLDIAFI